MELAKKKDHDYGPANIDRAGIFGNMNRMEDKWNRLKNLLGFNIFQEYNCDPIKFGLAVKNREVVLPEPNNESLEDTYRDLINYFAYMILISKDLWNLPRREIKK